jgi:hypothetical protein
MARAMELTLSLTGEDATKLLESLERATASLEEQYANAGAAPNPDYFRKLR